MQRSKWEDQHEPAPEGEEWVECGGQLIWAAGFTEAGFPYGLTEEEFRSANARCSPEAGWARAKRILEAVIHLREPEADVDVGYVKKMGQGLSRDTFAAEVEIATNSKRDVVEIAVLLPRRGCDPNIAERTQKEARILDALAKIAIPRPARLWHLSRCGPPRLGPRLRARR